MPSIGEILQETRKKKGISQEAAAKVLKVKVERLRDLEESRYDQFPAYVYVRSFLRHYANYLSLDSKELLERFAEENPPPDPKPIFEIASEQQTQAPVQHMPAAQSSSLFFTPTGKTVLAAIGVILILVSGSILWISKKNFQFPTLSQRTSPSSPVPQSSPPPAPAPVETEENLLLPSPTPTMIESPDAWETIPEARPIAIPALTLSTNELQFPSPRAP